MAPGIFYETLKLSHILLVEEGVNKHHRRLLEEEGVGRPSE